MYLAVRIYFILVHYLSPSYCSEKVAMIFRTNMQPGVVCVVYSRERCRNA